MPRPVVPMRRLPAKRSLTLSSVRWYGAMMCALALMSGGATCTSRLTSSSSSAASTPRSMTTPLPMTQVQSGLRMPEGNRCRTNFSPFTTTVCPALLPPE